MVEAFSRIAAGELDSESANMSKSWRWVTLLKVSEYLALWAESFTHSGGGEEALNIFWGIRSMRVGNWDGLSPIFWRRKERLSIFKNTALACLIRPSYEIVLLWWCISINSSPGTALYMPWNQSDGLFCYDGATKDRHLEGCVYGGES